MLKFDRSGDVRSRFAKLWRKKLLKQARVEGLWFHDIRRTGSTALYETMGDVRSAQKCGRLAQSVEHRFYNPIMTARR
jgi:integrase